MDSGAPRQKCRRIFDAYVAAGSNFINTASRYTEGTSERFVGKFVAAERELVSGGTLEQIVDRRP